MPRLEYKKYNCIIYDNWLIRAFDNVYIELSKFRTYNMSAKIPNAL